MTKPNDKNDDRYKTLGFESAFDGTAPNNGHSRKTQNLVCAGGVASPGICNVTVLKAVAKAATASRSAGVGVSPFNLSLTDLSVSGFAPSICHSLHLAVSG